MLQRKISKPWEQTRAEIEDVLDNCSDGVENDLTLANGIQHKCTITHNSSPIFSVAYRSSKKTNVEFYVMNYISPDSGESFFVQWRYDSLTGVSKLIKKVSVRQCLKLLVYIPNQHAFVGYCSDMTLRGYSGVTFEERSRLSVHSSVICMLYIEEFDELITAGQGYVFSWHMKMIEYGFLADPKNPPFFTEVNSTREWVTRLFYDKGSKTLMVMTDDMVYIISIVTRQQIEVFYNSHKSSLSCCTFYQPMQYFITTARDGSVHIYHTGLQSLVRSFAAHLDGVTGVACLSSHPIMITWSQKCGTMRMWRLDTLEMTNETTHSENINRLYVPKDDRLFYLGDTEVQIFAINVLYGIFNSLSSAIETMKLCSIRRARKSLGPEANPIRYSTDTVDSRNSMDSTKQKKSRVSGGNKRWSELLNKLEAVANPEEYFVKSMQDKNLGVDKTTYLDERLVCILDDYSVIEISPLSGLVINITYPTAEIDRKHLSIDIDRKGRSCFLALNTGSFVELNVTINPGQVMKCREPFKDDQKILSVVTTELYVDEGIQKGLRTHAVFVGLENGCVALSDLHLDTGAVGSRRASGMVAAAMRRKSTSKDSAEINLNAEPMLMMTPIQAHQGKVFAMLAPPEGSVIVDHEGHLTANIYNILITFGSDGKMMVWRASIVPGPLPNKFEVLLNKLQFLSLKQNPTCMAITSNVILLGFGDGQVEMYGFNWKYFVSNTGAIIKIECNVIVLPGFKKIAVDQELHHKQAVTSAHASQILNLFVTTAEDALIKIWDTDGMLVRELVLGAVVPSVCFALGRNLLAALKNHIVLIEAQTYLPVEYLQKLLKYADDTGITDPDPEKPLPLHGAEGSAVSMVKTSSAESEVAKLERHSTVEMPSKAELQNVQDDMKNINHLLRYLRRKRSFYTQAMEAVQKQEKVVEVFSGIHLKEYMPIVKVEDLSLNFLSDVEKERMQKFILAPDGEVPNSVVRVYFKPVRDVEFLSRITMTGTSVDSGTFFVELLRRERQTRRSSTYDEIYYVESDDSSFAGEFDESAPSLLRHQVLELSERSKWEMKDELLEKKMVQKLTSKLQMKVKRQTVVDSLKSLKSSKQMVGTSASEAAAEAQRLRLNKLAVLLQELQKQRWCSHIITPETFHDGMTAIAEIMQKAGTRICLEICKRLIPIIDASQELKPGDEHYNLFSVIPQRKFVSRLGELLFSPLNSLQRTAATLLSKFDDELLGGVLLHKLMPRFIETDKKGVKKLQKNDLVRAEAARLVKYFSFHIDTGRLYQLARLAKVDDYREDLTENETSIVQRIADSLGVAGVDSIDLVVWANFALPLLSTKKPLVVPPPPPYSPPPAPAAPSEEPKPEPEAKPQQTDLEATEAAAKSRRKSTKGGKAKGTKAAAAVRAANRKASLVDTPKKERKRKVSFLDEDHIAHAISTTPPDKTSSPEKKGQKPKKSILVESPKPDKKRESNTAEKGDAVMKITITQKSEMEDDSEMEDTESLVARTSSAEILRQSSRDLKQFPDSWVEDDELGARHGSATSLQIGGHSLMRLSTPDEDIPLKSSFEVIQPSKRSGRRHTLGSERDLHLNEQICILQSRRRLSLQRSSAVQAGRRISAHYTGVSRLSSQRSSSQDQSKVLGQYLTLEQAYLRQIAAEAEEDGRYESFLPAIAEKSAEFETVAGQDVLSETDKEDDFGSLRGISPIPMIYTESYSPSPPPPTTTSLCDDTLEEVTSPQDIVDFKHSSSYSEQLGVNDMPSIGDTESMETQSREITISDMLHPQPIVVYKDSKTRIDIIKCRTESRSQKSPKSRLKSSRSWPGTSKQPGTKPTKSGPESSKSLPETSLARPDSVKSRLESIIKASSAKQKKLQPELAGARPSSAKSWPESSKPNPELARYRPELQKNELAKHKPEELRKEFRSLAKPEKLKIASSLAKQQPRPGKVIPDLSKTVVEKIPLESEKYRAASAKAVLEKGTSGLENIRSKTNARVRPQSEKPRTKLSKMAVEKFRSERERENAERSESERVASDWSTTEIKRTRPQIEKYRSELSKTGSLGLYLDSSKAVPVSAKVEASKQIHSEAGKIRPQSEKPRREMEKVRYEPRKSRPASVTIESTKKRVEVLNKFQSEIMKPSSGKVRRDLAIHRPVSPWTELVNAHPALGRPSVRSSDSDKYRPKSARSCPESSVLRPETVISRFQSLVKSSKSQIDKAKPRLEVAKSMPQPGKHRPDALLPAPEEKPHYSKSSPEPPTSRSKSTISGELQAKLLAYSPQWQLDVAQDRGGDQETKADYLLHPDDAKLPRLVSPQVPRTSKPSSARNKMSRHTKDFSRLRKEFALISDDLESPDSWRRVLEALREVRLKKEERRRKYEEYKHATSYPCPPSPAPSLYPHGLKSKEKGDYVAHPFSHDGITTAEYLRQVERPNILAGQSYKSVTDESVIGVKDEKVRQVLDRVIFAPNRVLSHNLQLLRRKLKIFMTHSAARKQQKVAETKAQFTCGDQPKSNEKVRYKWDHTGCFTHQPRLSSL